MDEGVGAKIRYRAARVQSAAKAPILATLDEANLKSKVGGDGQQRASTPAAILFIAVPEAKDNIEPV